MNLLDVLNQLKKHFGVPQQGTMSSEQSVNFATINMLAGVTV